MRFAQAELLWLLLLLPAFAAAGWWTLQRRARALQRFAGGPGWTARFTAEVSLNRRAVKLILVWAGLALLIVAAARPQWGTQFEEVTRAGADVIAVLDTSLSMAAVDVAPSRIDLARHGIDTLLKRMTGDRVGLVTFSGQAVVACPLTLDHAAVRLFLDATDTEAVGVPGTALADALRLALEAFGETEDGGEVRSRAIVLFTDGEDHEGGLDEITPELERARVAVYTIGVGTARGAPIPLSDESGTSVGYKTDRAGQVVTTRLDESTLEWLALQTGGQYHRSTAAQEEIELVSEALTALDDQEFGAVLRARYKERFQIPLALAFLAFLVEALLSDRKRSAAKGPRIAQVRP